MSNIDNDVGTIRLIFNVRQTIQYTALGLAAEMMNETYTKATPFLRGP